MTTRKTAKAEPEPALTVDPEAVQEATVVPDPAVFGQALADAVQAIDPDRDRRWDLLAAPFPPGQMEWLPKVLFRNDQDKGRCEAGSPYCADAHPCGGWHARAIHLTYVGHAGVTMRLNSVDPSWSWEPLAWTDHGTPLFSDGGLWIRLTVLGQTRIGFGDAQGKGGPNAIKETIGDAIRNAAMRFGVGTYLWSKSEDAQVLAAGGEPEAVQPRQEAQQRQEQPRQEQRQQRGRQQRQEQPQERPAQEPAQQQPEGISDADAEALAVRIRALSETGQAAVRAKYVEAGGPRDMKMLLPAQAATLEGWISEAEIEDAKAAVADAASGGDPWETDKPPF